MFVATLPCCSMWDLSLQRVGSFIAVHELFVAARGPLSSCGARAPERACSVVAACGLSGCGAWALELTGLVALRHLGS